MSWYIERELTFANSHIYPSTLRHQMAELWGIPEVNEWWLTDEGTCPPVVRSVRSFMENRLPQAEGQSRSEDQRNIKGFFSQLSLHESPKAGLIQASGVGLPTPLESANLSAGELALQRLADHETGADEDEDENENEDMDSDDSMPDQSHRSFPIFGSKRKFG